VTVAGAAGDDRLSGHNFEEREIRQVRAEAAHFRRRVGAVDREDYSPQPR